MVVFFSCLHLTKEHAVTKYFILHLLFWKWLNNSHNIDTVYICKYMHVFETLFFFAVFNVSM